MFRVVNILLAVIFVVAQIVNAVPAAAIILPPSNPELIITELKVRNQSTGHDELIELFNTTEEPLRLSEYFLEYTAGTNISSVQIGVQMLAAKSYIVLTKQTRDISHVGFIPHSTPLPFSDLDHTGGTLRIVKSDNTIIDEISWTKEELSITTAGVYPAVVLQCQGTSASCTSLSITRVMELDGSYNVNSPSWHMIAASPVSSILTDPPDPEPEEDPGAVEESETPPLTCEGLVITEVLPNPEGSDANGEFIELFNPTNEFINLGGCALQVSGSTKQYALPSVNIDPGMYASFSAQTTGLTLPNSAGGTVWLLSPTDEIAQVAYPPDLDDDESWSFINSQWQISYAPTPGLKNIAMSLKPCPEGQARTEDNTKCQTIILAAGAALTPCKIGQERNPATNRCKNIANLSSISLTPCKQGQERNPDTNRCRNVLGENTLTPCDNGEERNPDTNRCRKIVAGASETLADIKDVKSPMKNNGFSWVLVVVVIALAAGYAIYEWRNDISLRLRKLASVFKK